MLRLLLLVPTTTYRTEDFLTAAGKLDVEVTVASERPSTLEAYRPDGLLTLDFADPEGAAAKAAEFSRRYPLDAVVAVDDLTAVAGAAIARRLGLRASAPAAVADSRNKARMRAVLAKGRVPQPAYELLTLADDPERAATRAPYPCVLKPTVLSGSRGVIRADDPAQFVAAFRRIAAILAEPEVAGRGGGADQVLVEGFVPGPEVALEGLLVEGRLHVLALFDKPDPLEGPFFEETLYVTPSRLPAAVQESVAAITGWAALALGLREGPVHAELRVGPGGPWLIELAARSIGGLCSRTLRFGTGLTLEEIILRHALGIDPGSLEREARAAGVMMLPIPRAGVLEAVRGREAALAVPGVEDITISAHVGQTLVPLPEGHQYLGFAFARAATPDAVEAALREAHRRLVFDIRPAGRPAEEPA